ncbi:hypothetical protein VNI00_015078 [Paramarasmius palmivorus]|uniref:DUF6534 domain-containing protein n=1 Tax=Paramarasmius palmivorus TaxID=297713 RepID=A0AAW0BN75_9AGAR
MSSTRLDSQNTTGHALIGIMIASCLYGVTALQIWHYFRSYNDRFLIRAMVMALAFVTLHHSGGRRLIPPYSVLGIGFELASMHAIYHRVVVNPGNPGTFAWTDLASIPLTVGVLSSSVARLLNIYLRLVFVLSYTCSMPYEFICLAIKGIGSPHRYWALYLLIAKRAPLLIGLAITATIRVRPGELSSIGDSIFTIVWAFECLRSDSQTVTLASLSFLIASDVISTLVLSYYLHICRSGVKKTDTLINRLILYTINNGALTTAASIAVMIFLTSHSLIYYVIYMTVAHCSGSLRFDCDVTLTLCCSTVYIGSLLSTLNSRDQIVNSRKHITIDTVELGSLQFANGWIASTNAGTNATKAGEIKVTRMVNVGVWDTGLTQLYKTPVQVLVETQVESEDPNRDRKSSVEIRQAAGGSQPDIQINQ